MLHKIISLVEENVARSSLTVSVKSNTDEIVNDTSAHAKESEIDVAKTTSIGICK